MNYIKLGQAISRAKVSRCGDNDYPVLSITMKDGIVMQSDKFKKRIASKDISEYKVIPAGMLVQGIHMDEGNFGIQDIVPYGIVSPAYTVWTVDESVVFPKYIEMVLRSPRCIDYYRSKLNGTVNRRGHMSEGDFLGMQIPCPSIEEQKHVVITMNQAKQVITSLTEEMTALDQLIKARFVEMFGDENNSKNLPVIKIQDVADVQVGVVIKPAQYYTDEANGTKAFRSLNIGEMHIKDSDWVFFNDEGQKKNSKSILRANDLVIVRSGAPGTACVITKEYEGANAIDVIIAHPDMDKVNPLYLCAFTNYPHGKRQINEGTGGAAQQHFNVGKYKEMDLIYPPKHEQDEFVAFVKQVDKSKVEVQKTLEKTQLLFNSLMQGYFGT